MCLSPDHSWYWFFDEKEQRLALSLGEYVFMSAYTEKQLIPDAFYQQAFTAEHTEQFYQLQEQLPQQLQLSQGQLLQLVFNVIAARFMTLPMMPKSWFFETSNTIVYPRNGRLVSLQNQHQRGQFLVIEATEQASLLMLIDDLCQLNEQKSIEQFALIKVMNDRLMPTLVNNSAVVVAA
ncbi:cell division protein ZapC domain-containing protein [Ferrimonas senticii]|uniref:cell division protein ZapC domain-containing protein n=1 Tax=Ferrimonas senticii TaxID=394566 RepID=UPI000480443C|nr:cell division protein ZapC domain-containing protein [Ferrimonas senticii]